MNQEADYSMTEQAFTSINGMGGPGDETLLVRFNTMAMQDHRATSSEGRPIFKEVEMIEIMAPGNKETVLHYPVKDEDRRRFPKQYAMWKQNKDTDGIIGTPLGEWVLNKAQVEEFKFFNVITVEQLAGMSDGNGQNIMGFQQLRTRAKAYLESRGDVIAGESLAEALAERDAVIGSQQEQINELLEAVQNLQKSTHKGK